MQFTVQINSNNAALVDDPQGEIARLLRHAANNVAEGNMDGVLRDYNGNTVGSFAFNE